MADEKRENLISAQTADALIAAHDGDMALYCLYISRHPGADDDTAAAVLCRTRGEIAAAREKLGRILPAGKRMVPAPPEDEQTQYDGAEIVKTLKEKSFEPILAEMTRILGAIPSKAYLNTLVDIYDRLGMPPEVILLLLNYCDAEARRLWSSGRRPSPRFISAEAYRWANREILTMELAEEYISHRKELHEGERRIKELLGIRGRDLSPTETRYIESWQEMGLSDELIAAALDRTLTNIGALKWPYLNGILKKWHAADYRTLEDVERAEGNRRSKPGDGRGYGDPVDTIDVDDFMRR